MSFDCALLRSGRKVSVISKPYAWDIHRHLQNKVTAHSGRAFQLDISPMREDDLTRDAQPQAHPFHNTPSLAAADERLKDFFLFTKRNTRPIVFYLYK